MRVLIADDDQTTVTALAGMLGHLGHEPLVAYDGHTAWEILNAQPAPPLAIIDWMMPGLEGPEICRRVRQQTGTSYKYLIMLTAKDQMEHLVQSIECGADDYLKKPFDERELRARLHAGARILTLRDELEAKATFDELTGLLNRATVRERLSRALAERHRRDKAVSVVIADLDGFKEINDTHGHAIGDDVLREAAQRLASSVRPYDELARYGGEEFLVVLPGCERACGLSAAERMRGALRARPVATSAGSIRLTASFGVATASPWARIDADALIRLADEALYRAKREGRDRVEEAPVAG